MGMVENKALSLRCFAEINFNTRKCCFGFFIQEYRHIAATDYRIAFPRHGFEAHLVLVTGTAPACHCDADAQDVAIIGFSDHPPDGGHRILR